MSRIKEKAEEYVSSASSKAKLQGNHLLNPFASSWDKVAGKDEYGRPPEGSLTEMRGIKAHLHVHKEIEQLCQIIKQYGYETKDGWVITFGELFKIYVSISDKVVGMLLRARKHGLVDFIGEMLYQRRDDDVPIMLRKIPRTPVHSRSPSPMPPSMAQNGGQN